MESQERKITRLLVELMASSAFLGVIIGGVLVALGLWGTGHLK